MTNAPFQYDPQPLPAPTPPPPPKRRNWVLAGAILGAAGLLAGAGALVFVTDSGSGDAATPETTEVADDTVNVWYSVEVVSDSYCRDFEEDTGYGDLRYGEAELFDGAGNLLGFGTLDGGDDTDTSCIFEVNFQAERSPDGMYRITAGNVNRGYINYSEADIVDGTLMATAILGN